MIELHIVLTAIIASAATVIICAVFGLLMVEADKHQKTLINRTRQTDKDEHEEGGI